MRKELKHGFHVCLLHFRLLSEALVFSRSLAVEPLLLSLHLFPVLLKLQLHQFGKLLHDSVELQLTNTCPHSVQKEKNPRCR